MIPLTEIENSTLSQAVKWVMLCNANGQVADDVFLLSDASMNEEEFTVTEIKGLSHNVDPSASGWLCFAKTRGGNKNFFFWYMTKIVTKFVAACRENLP